VRIPRRRTTPHPSEVILRRLTLLADTVREAGRTEDGAQPVPEVRSTVRNFLAAEGADGIWLVSSVLHARFPDPADVISARRVLKLDGPAAVLEALEATVPRETLGLQVRVVTDSTLVGVHQLARSEFTTGVQRVAQEAVRRWRRDHDVELVVWTPGFGALCEPTTAEVSRAMGEDIGSGQGSPTQAVVVPWGAQFLMPEIALDAGRTSRTRGLLLHSRCRTGAIAFDLVPITMSETTDTGVSSDFAHHLAALRHTDRLAAISEATCEEYEGWRMMTSAAGHGGPDVRTVVLPVEAREPSEQALADVRREYLVPTVPLVLCVGSHEPRKNHVGVLRAAEVLWQRGEAFTLLFVGGNSWGGAEFRGPLARAVRAGRDVRTETNLGEDQLWALYHLARCTVFPSLSEGFGLPVAESLAAGTPVITSDFGSMAEIAADGGALLVDPRDTVVLAAALSRLLHDDALHARLTAAARARPSRSWDDYARETWSYLAAADS